MYNISVVLETMYLTACRIQHDENERAELECYELCFQRVIQGRILHDTLSATVKSCNLSCSAWWSYTTVPYLLHHELTIARDPHIDFVNVHNFLTAITY